jgi:hypothetical protein
MVTSEVRIRKAAEWPVPVARWQSSHEHMNIERTVPAKRAVTAPQAHDALRSISGRAGFSIAGGWHAASLVRKLRLSL